VRGPAWVLDTGQALLSAAFACGPAALGLGDRPPGLVSVPHQPPVFVLSHGRAIHTRCCVGSSAV
jgi:hypothetical protein